MKMKTGQLHKVGCGSRFQEVSKSFFFTRFRTFVLLDLCRRTFCTPFAMAHEYKHSELQERRFRKAYSAKMVQNWRFALALH